VGGNKYKLLNYTIHHGITKFSFWANVENIWKGLPNSVVDVDTVNLFEAHFKAFLWHQDVKYGFTVDTITRIGNRNETSVL